MDSERQELWEGGEEGWSTWESLPDLKHTEVAMSLGSKMSKVRRKPREMLSQRYFAFLYVWGENEVRIIFK